MTKKQIDKLREEFLEACQTDRDYNTGRNCYTCKHRGTIPGDAHTHCKNPMVNSDDFLAAMFTSDDKGASIMPVLISVEYSKKPPKAFRIPAVMFNPQGVQRGWVQFPFNFDPQWCTMCAMWEKK